MTLNKKSRLKKLMTNKLIEYHMEIRWKLLHKGKELKVYLQVYRDSYRIPSPSLPQYR
jgi:hypothetical protein